MNLNIRTSDLMWSIVVTFCASFMAFYIPLDLVIHLKSNQAYVWTNIVASAILIVDIFYSIYKAKYHESEFVFEEKSGLELYFRKWFAIDFIAALPLNVFGFLSFLQLFRLVKLFKIANIMRHFRQREVQYANALTLIFFLFWVFHFAHWLACGWMSLRGIDHSLTVFDNYIRSFYWTVTTITTVGYGDIVPVNSQQILFAVFVEILGVGSYGYLIGKIASFLAKKDPAKSRYLSHMEYLTAMVKLRKLPLDLQTRLRNYYTYMWKQKSGFDESKFLDGLPYGLKTEVSIFLKQEVIEKIPLFKDSEDNFTKEVALHLKPVILTPGDFVFKEGDEGHEMYFVVNGRLEVLLGKSEKILGILSDGDFFGEIALFSNVPRTASVRSLTYCDLYTLSRNRFDHVVAKFPEIGKQIKAKAESRLKKQKNGN